MRADVVATVSALLLAGACASGDPAAPTSAGSPAPVSQVAAVTAPRELEHIHNLALTDAGTLLLGTHEGLFRQEQPGDRLERVGEPFDVMGLSVVQTRWLASGHPPEGTAGHSALGLVRSQDDGTTWDSVALSGRVDFHRLVQSKAAILGVNSGDGMVWRSDDGGRSWTTLGPAPFDVAMDPRDPDRVLGTTADGLVVSTNGGSSWSRSPSDVRLSFLSWGPSALYGLGLEGDVHRSRDSGASWEQVGEVTGTPSALASVGDQVAVLSGGQVWVSQDAAKSFQPRVTGIPEH